jgi:hypothetical protein
MGIQIQGNGGNIAEVDGTTFRALRVTARPIDYGALGFYQVGAVSGTMAAALGANSEIYQFRWPDATRFACPYSITTSAGANVAATAAALNAFHLTQARSWSAAGTGGTRFTMTGNTGKLRTSMGTSLVNDIGIATTAALVAGTKTLDATNTTSIAVGIGTGAITTAINLQLIDPRTPLFDCSQSGNHPIVYAQNEGFVVRVGSNAFPATMTWHFGVTAAWAEVAAF